MKLSEALKSGHPFRRPADKNYYVVHKDGYVVPMGTTDHTVFTVLPMTFENVLAEDWEVEEPTVVLGQTQFRELVQEALSETVQIQNSFLGTYIPGNPNQVLNYIEHKLFGGNK